MLTPVIAQRMLLSALSGVLTAFALPNELFARGNAVLGLLCLVPYFLALRQSVEVLSPFETPSRWRRHALVGATYGIVSGFLSNYWLMFFGEFSVWTIGGVTFGFALYHSVLAPILATTRRMPGWARPVALALFFAAYDYLRSVGFLGYPWGLMAYPGVSILPLIQHVEITGVWLLSFFFVLGNAAVTEGLILFFLQKGDTATAGRWSVAWRTSGAGGARDALTDGSRAVAVGTGVFVMLAAGMLTFGYAALRAERPVTATARMLLVQQNSDSWARGNELNALAQVQELTLDGLQVAAENGPLDLVVWSETSLRRLYTENSGFYREKPPTLPFLTFLRQLPTPLLTGAPVLMNAEQREVGNGALLIEKNGEVIQWYAKQQLVPFAERIPFWHIPAVQALFRRAVGLTGVWTPGREHRLFELQGVQTGAAGTSESRTVRYGTPICFEDAFGYLCREFVSQGADLLINLTNNSWSRTDSAQIQHYVAAKFRSVENRITLVRSTNSGLTTVVDPWGRQGQTLPMFESRYLVVDVPIYAGVGNTLYTTHGDYLGKSFAAASVLIVLGALYRRRRERLSPVPSP